MESLVFSTAQELATAIRDRKVSAVDVLNAHLEQITLHNPKLNAIITLDEEGAQERARAADDALARGEIWGPLHGVPITLKDVHDTAGVRTTMGHVPFVDRIPSEDNSVAARLKEAGSILVGKTNLELFDDNPFGIANNPWDIERTSGGSSSGAAAALASGMTPLDIGSDMGGSIISPSHFSGICGMRHTEHRVPLGNFPSDTVRIWHVLGTFGPMARSVQDLRLGLMIIAGADRNDTDVPPITWREVPLPVLHDLNIAWTPNFPNTPISTDIMVAIEELARTLEKQGATISQSLPDINIVEQTQLALSLWGLVLSAFDDKSPASLGAYFEALQKRDVFSAKWESFFDEQDVLLCPAGKTTAPRHTDTILIIDGKEVPPGTGVDPFRFTSVTGHPSVVIPLTRDRNGLPIGVQIIGRRWGDERLLAIAEIISDVTGGFQRPPGY